MNPLSNLGTNLSTPIIAANSDKLHVRAYKQVLGNLKEHIGFLVNYYVAQDILERLKKYKSELPDASNLYRDFIDLLAPQETMTLLQNFSDKLKEYIYDFSHFPNEGENAYNVLRQDLKQLVDEIEPNIVEKSKQDWEELNILLNIPQIKMADSHIAKTLLVHLHSGDRHAFKDSIKSLCTDQMQINNYLLKRQWGDGLDTLTDEIFEMKPKKNEGITAYWDKPESFFFDKTIYLTDPTSGETYSGTIILAERKNRALAFYLHDRSVARISSHYEVEIEQNYFYKSLFSQILRGTLQEDEIFQIELAASADHSTNGIQAGLYMRGKAETKKDKLLYPYIEISLLDQKKEPKYLLWGYTEGGYIKELQVKKWVNKDKSKDLFKCTPEQFDRKYSAIKVITKKLNGVDKENVDKCVVVKDEPDENKITTIRSEQIKKEIEEIRLDLLKEGSEELLGALLDNFIINQLIRIDLSTIKISDQWAAKKIELEKKLTEISLKYTTDLKMDRSPEDILMQVVQEANYAKLVNKENNVLIAKTMELLSASDKHLQEMNSQEIVLFMGNTGSGKSTAVSYFLNVELELFTNRIGDQVLRKKEKSGNEEQSPKIGQSFSTSETIYTQGYRVPNSAIKLADCPGFNDTRGGDYELCTNMSIDQTVNNAKKVRAIVLVVPVNAFLIDRANNVIDLINTVKERFPGAFDPDDNKNTPAIYLLITKENQAPSTAVDAIRDGIRFTEYLKEMTKSLEALQTRGLNSGDFEYDACLSRQKIWRALVKMQQNGQVDIMGITNSRLKDRLRKKYIDSNIPIQKLNYQNAMQGEDMQKKFGDCIQQSSHTWTKLIFTEYLEVLPRLIKDSDKEMQKKVEEKELLKEELSSRAIKLQEYLASKLELENILQSLRGNPDLLTPELRQELESKVLASNQAELNSEEIQYKELTKSIDSKKTKQQELSKQIGDAENMITNMDKEISKLRTEITALKTGSTRTNLYTTEKHQPYDKIKINYYSSSDFNKVKMTAFSEVSEQNYSKVEKLSSKEVLAKNFKGIDEKVVIIDKKYKLVPINQTLREQFESTGQAGEYTAQLEGVGYELDLGRKTTADGHKIAYSYKLHWIGDGSKLPWFSIFHVIPNHALNAATIVNKDAEILLCESRVAECRVKLAGTSGGIAGLNKELGEIKADLTSLESKQKISQSKIEQLKKTKTLAQINILLKQKEEQLQNTLNDIEELTKTDTIDQKIANIDKEIGLRNKEIEKLRKKKRNYALIIKTQLHTAILLRNFSRISMNSHRTTNRTKPVSETHTLADQEQETLNAFANVSDRLVQACEGFNQIYDREIKQIEEKVNKELGLPKEHRYQMASQPQTLKNDQGGSAALSIHNSFSQVTNVADLL